MESEDVAYDVFSRTCPSRPALDVLTGRWGMLALSALRTGPMRFNELRRRIDGVNQKMLAQSLQALERDGFVDRRAQGVFPLHVRYSLTPLGEAAAAKVQELIALVEGRMPEVLGAQRRYDERAAES
ncbi:winged helix-turn-helix transcriptional regulator [Saccharothrix coeruleofusca]|uniref:HxlR family transcriptional regulator n=1 Tax=Saccharothrix coeruleofusca TaxID=33919 RepID=A0A918AIU6_9PSEU|nr:helix-turn-helix domain-containing protein [Saccharothrix coeruleofusca]MBP2334275.1 DNA-binding HxlR family transcriptional regulator [Saccharothrix coeruleofusca]GGP42237.1 HxlR family transcriptional regulator [Saccharothrix coeruleofusca]